MKSSGGRGPIISERDVLNFTSTSLSHLVQEKPVHRTANTKCKNTCVLMFLNLAYYFHIVADVSVGHKANYPDVILLVGRFQRYLDCSHHFGAAASPATVQKS